MRQYQPIWNAIRDTGRATVTVSKPMHARVIRAVKKEKCKDIGWRILNADCSSRKLFIDTTRPDQIIFTLYNIHSPNKPKAI